MRDADPEGKNKKEKKRSVGYCGDTGLKCKSVKLLCLIINHFVTVTTMYYSNLQVNYMVTVVIR